MAIRIRRAGGMLVAICAARSVEKEGDLYLDDGVHHALSAKFSRDFAEMGFIEPSEWPEHAVMDTEESNNANRDWWDMEYGEGCINEKGPRTDVHGG
jgi:hypothetical protein